MTFLAMLQQGASIQVCHANSDDWSGGVRHAHAFTSISANFTHRKEVLPAIHLEKLQKCMRENRPNTEEKRLLVACVGDRLYWTAA